MPKALPKFKLHVAAVKPGDFGPCGLAVWADDYRTNEIVYDGHLVEALGEVWIEVDGSPDDRYELEYRKVRTSSGFEGTVCWHAFDGRSGFEKI